MSSFDSSCHPRARPLLLDAKVKENTVITTLADVLAFLDNTGMGGTRRRDMVSAIKRVCDMAGSTPACVPAEVLQLRETLSHIRPAAHSITVKSYSNIRS